jgi:hypothetical protein
MAGQNTRPQKEAKEKKENTSCGRRNVEKPVPRNRIRRWRRGSLTETGRASSNNRSNAHTLKLLL